MAPTPARASTTRPIGRIAVETDPARRRAMISEAGGVVRDDVACIPLHQQQIVWAVRNSVEVVQKPNNYFENYVELRDVRMGQ